MEPKKDKRQFSRIQRAFLMRIAVDDGNPWPNWSLVSTHNLSAGGALFTFDQKVQAGQSLLCKLHFLDHEIDCRARVIRFEPGYQPPLVHLAVLFEGLTDQQKALVERMGKNLALGK